MSTLRKQTRSGYTHISNELINTEGLSYRAKGVAMVLLSKPDDWVIKVDYLAHIGKEGEEAIRTAMKELAVFGFLMRDRVQESDGSIRTVTYLADYPAYIDVGTAERRIYGYQPKATDLAVSEGSENQTSENQTSESRQVEKRQVLVTPELLTTEQVKVNRKSKQGASPKSRNRSYLPPPDIDPLTRH